MVKRNLFLQAAVAAAVVLLVGCGGKEEASSGSLAQSDKETKPVELTIMPNGSITDAQFEAFIREPLSKKYPHITLKVVKAGSGVSLNSLLMAGQLPDVWIGAYKDTEVYVRDGMPNDLNEFAKQAKIDISKFEPQAIATIKGFAKNGELYALPYMMNYGALFYNKDIFDKFGVSYPKDGSTWDDLLEAAKKLTRADGGVNYIGLDPTSPAAVNVVIGNSVGKGTSVDINNDNWKNIFAMLQQAYEIPGFIQGKKSTYGSGAFMNDRNLAMVADWADMIGKLDEMRAKGQPLNWDMATHPNFKQYIGKGRDTGAHAFYMSNGSKHKEEAFRVIETVTGEDVQRLANRQGKLTILAKTDTVKKEYGQDIQDLQGKNKDAIFKMKPTDAVTHPYYSIISSALTKYAGLVALKEKDINTALKEAQEEATKLIAEQEAAKK
ncbi:MAG: extracellular solute-binding protein family 1 [Paenibacillus sp.]|nr:extracellular solute-binding protein family 1 [Paenibacillus sp.]